MKQIFKYIAFIAIAISLVMLCSCKKNNDEIPSGSAVIQFKDLDVQTVQQLVQGKWRIIKQCGGVAGCVDITDFSHEYIGADKLRITNGNKVDEKEIIEWKKITDGYEIIVSTTGSDSVYAFTLNSLVRDTLSFGTQPDRLPVFGWQAIRVK